MNLFDQGDDFTWHREPYRTNPMRRLSRLVQLLALCTLLTVLMVWLAVAALGASGWEPRPGCGYTVQAGDTLTAITENLPSTPQSVVAATPHVTDVDLIYAGTAIDICPTSTVTGTRPTLAEPGRASEWADAIRTTAPGWATDGDVRLLVALAGPESDWCRSTVNPGDAAPPVWGPSIGCLQTRTFLQASDLTVEPWRNRVWLEASLINQAESAWIIYQMQGGKAWGPRRPDAAGGVKLPDDCRTSSMPEKCVGWWATADRLLAG